MSLFGLDTLPAVVPFLPGVLCSGGNEVAHAVGDGQQWIIDFWKPDSHPLSHSQNYMCVF